MSFDLCYNVSYSPDKEWKVQPKGRVHYILLGKSLDSVQNLSETPFLDTF